VKARGSEADELITGLTVLHGYTLLCSVLQFALQQLAEGVQQYLQQGQLPAALTERVLDACYALCSALVRVCRMFEGANYDAEEGPELMRRKLYENAVQEGALYPALLPIGVNLSHKCCGLRNSTLR
jgi:hypothetical protein